MKKAITIKFFIIIYKNGWKKTEYGKNRYKKVSEENKQRL